MTDKWTVETRAIELRVAPGDNTGNTFEGLACAYGVVDAYGTTFQPGCFTRGGLDGKTYPLLWMHDPTRPVGTFTAEERVDGLYIVGQWDVNSAGQEARIAAMSGSAADLSVGFSWTGDGFDIVVAELREVSQVTSRFGAVPGSKLTAVRNVIESLFDEEEETAVPAVSEPAVEEIAVPAEDADRWNIVIEVNQEDQVSGDAAEVEVPVEEVLEVAEPAAVETVEVEKAASKKRAIEALQAYARYLAK